MPWRLTPIEIGRRTAKAYPSNMTYFQYDFNMVMEAYLSKPRWNSYRVSSDETDEEILKRYLCNIQLCEALYPILHLAEVVLRNQMDTTISAVFGDAWLSEESTVLGAYEKSEVLKARQKLTHNSRGHLIAELQFGFWTGLFKKHYRNVIWHQCIKPMFPYLSKVNRHAGFVSVRLDDVRRLRNRVFHHEPILEIPQLG
jgi:hypothetical protein